MKVLFLDQFSEMGGGQQCLRDVLIETRNRGWQAELMAPGDGPLLTEARKLGCEACSLPLGDYTHGRKTFDDLVRFRCAIRECRRVIEEAIDHRGVDIVYVNGPRLLPAVSEVSAPLLFHAHSVPNKWYASLAAALALRRPRTRIIACSEFAARPLRRWMGFDSVRVIYNGVQDHEYRTESTTSPLRIGMLGRISPEKGAADFVQVARRLKHEKGFTLRVIGGALFSNSEYDRSVRGAGEAAGIEFHPWTESVARALHDLDIVLLPSAWNDACPRVVLDAFSAGVAVIAYPSGGIPELIQHGNNGLLTVKRSPNELAELVRQIAGDASMRKRLIANGRASWEASFQLKRYQKDVCDVIANCVTTLNCGSTEARFAPAEAASSHDEERAAQASSR